MYYLELIQKFWKFNEHARLGSTSIAMYMFLLKTASENNNYKFKTSDVTVSSFLGLTRKTIKSTKEKLRNNGLIEYNIRNGLPCEYRLILNYSIEKLELDSNEEIINHTNAVNLSESNNLYVDPTSLQKNKLIDEHKSSLVEELQLEIPSVEDFLLFAESLESYNTSLKKAVVTKYESWIVNGWQNTSGRTIKSWKLTLKSIIPFLNNELNQQDSLSLQEIPQIKRP